MPSFATEVKNELAHQDEAEKPCCRRAELAALLRLGGKWGEEGGLSFVTENAAVARAVFSLLKRELPGVLMKIAVSRGRRLKKTNSYAIMIMPSPKLAELLGQDKGDDKRAKTFDKRLLRRACCRLSYLKGAFMAAGSVNRPTAAYHLEIAAENEAVADLIHDLMLRLEFPVGIYERKEAYVVYIKEGDAVIDFLGMLKAEAATEAMETAKNVKEVREHINRLVNCETANLQRSGDAAARQITAIRALEKTGRLAALNKTLRETAQARLDNPECSLGELASLLCISKSGLNNRLRKIMKLTQKSGDNI